MRICRSTGLVAAMMCITMNRNQHKCSAFVLPLNLMHPFLLPTGSQTASSRGEVTTCLAWKRSSEEICQRRRSTKRFYANSSQEQNRREEDSDTDRKRVSPRARRRGRYLSGPINTNPYNIPPDAEEKWEFFYSLLLTFFKENGHTNVEAGPKVNQSLLRNWMAEQRRSHMKTLEILLPEEVKDVQALSPEKKKRLDDAGFHWGHFGDIDVKQVTENTLKLAVDPERDEKWVPMFELLKQYRAECGSTDVPFEYENGLGRWVDKQRRLMTIMPNRRRAMLDQLEFVWCHEGEVELGQDVEKGRNILWSERLEELKHYKRKHGHCDVPLDFEGDSSLGEWVRRQRKAYNLWLAGKRAPINEKRVLALQMLGFDFNSNLGNGRQ